jgi:hypothetical protein
MFNLNLFDVLLLSREKQLPDLETLNNFIEEAGCDPTKCLHNLELMSAEVEKILQDVDRFEKHIIAKHYPSIAVITNYYLFIFIYFFYL